MPSLQADEVGFEGPNGMLSHGSKTKDSKEIESPLPSISLPKGGGAIRGTTEKIGIDEVTGSASLAMSLNITSMGPGRGAFQPSLSLSYDSGSGNGPFGWGWHLSLPAITRKTDRGLPMYRDDIESDQFMLLGSEDLVPLQTSDARGNWARVSPKGRTVDGEDYLVSRYRPRIEESFSVIERWTKERTGEIHWRTISNTNVITLYGTDDDSRVFDPRTPNRVYSWLIAKSYDDRGSVILYGYEREDSENVDFTKACERNRTPETIAAARYLKRIKYGNVFSRLTFPEKAESEWLFEVVLDYGDHDTMNPLPQRQNRWSCRNDPFSVYRSGFEVRHYRLCRRVLMFHHFPDEPDIGRDCLVSSTDLVYRNTRNEPTDTLLGNPMGSFVETITQTNYVRNGGSGQAYEQASMPPMEFHYSMPVIHDAYQELNRDSLRNLPGGTLKHQWLDLDAEGIPGLFSEQGHQWFYNRNTGNATFGVAEVQSSRPSFPAHGYALHFADLAGDGHIDLVSLDPHCPGFFRRTSETVWDTLKPFASLPNIDWADPNLSLVDLTGDGHADIFVDNDGMWIRYVSLADEGYASGEFSPKATNEELGPVVTTPDKLTLVQFADMSGDGLNDLVRITSSEVCYWPNTGYGTFGSKVEMENWKPPAVEGQFDPSRIRLADIDGSGTMDIIYLGTTTVSLHPNQSGNKLADPQYITTLPQADNITDVSVIDLFGSGTSCIVWSSALPGEVGHNIGYIDILGSQKPHLLVSMQNNLGAETRIEYAPSTKFYLQDKAIGTPWITRLAFPVHVVSQIETIDHVGKNRATSRFSYHHGYFDGTEREFRGFGRVDKIDTEELDPLADPVSSMMTPASHIPPVLTRTWYHTGTFPESKAVSRFFHQEYFQESVGETADQRAERAAAMTLPDTEFPRFIWLSDGTRADISLSPQEAQESLRSLKGKVLRQETYALDGSLDEGSEAVKHLLGLPYLVQDHSYTIQMLQPVGPNRHAVYFTLPLESVEYYYERRTYPVPGAASQSIMDPRVSHTLLLDSDQYGNVRLSVDVSYGRRKEDQEPQLTNGDRAEQTRLRATYTTNEFTKAADSGDEYRTPLKFETRTFELFNLGPKSSVDLTTNLLRANELQNQLASFTDDTHDLPFDDYQGTGATDKSRLYRRLIAHARTYFRSNDLSSVLPLGSLESMAIPHTTLKLAMMPDLISQQLVGSGKLSQSELDNILSRECRYVHSEGDANWWIRTGEKFFSPSGGTTDELTFARQHFFNLHRSRDPLHQDTTFDTEVHVRYDKYDLLVEETRDAVGNRLTVGERNIDPDKELIHAAQDYRLLRPLATMDPNRNQSKVAYDILGRVVALAVLGKPGQAVGDRIEGVPGADDPTVKSYFRSPLGALSKDLLARATTRYLYDAFAYMKTKSSQHPRPVASSSIKRDVHQSDILPGGRQTRLFHEFSYTNGYGAVIQTKTRAEAGPVPERDPETSRIIVGDDGQPKMTPGSVDPRWVGSGWTVFNNKGKPVRTFEPFFTDTHEFEFDARIGVSSETFYDPLDRSIGELHPDHTWTKYIFDAWKSETWDTNDTAATDPTTDEHLGPFFARLDLARYRPTWYEARAGGALGTDEKTAALKTEVHRGTPKKSFLNSLGQEFLGLDHNRYKHGDDDSLDPPAGEFIRSVTAIDIAGHQRQILDAKGRRVATFDYDMLGNNLHQNSTDSGQRWRLRDVVGQELYVWDSRDHRFHYIYDVARRPLETRLLNLGVASPIGPDLLIEKRVFSNNDADQAQNARGEITHSYDQSGVTLTTHYDFKGNLLDSETRLSSQYKSTIDWTSEPSVPLEGETWITATVYNAFDRPVQITEPDQSVIKFEFNDANLVESIKANIRGQDPDDRTFISNIDYNAKGQRTRVDYGNGTSTMAEFDTKTFRLRQLITKRRADRFPDDDPVPPVPSSPGKFAQNLHYVYDPVGNVMRIDDNAQQLIYFRGNRVEPSSEYTYDSLYRLIDATGREHLGQDSNGRPNAPSSSGAADPFRTSLDHPGNSAAMGTYIERYSYNRCNNIQTLEHHGTDPRHPGWTRIFNYAEASQIDAAEMSNRLSSTATGDGTISERFRYAGSAGRHGCMTEMGHLKLMEWDHNDMLRRSSRQIRTDGGTPEKTFYVYDSTGKRVRKVTEREADLGSTPKPLKERIYIGNCEIFRRYNGDGTTVKLERQTLHVMNNTQRICMIETRTRGSEAPRVPGQLVRFQHSNNIGSACLELDHDGQIISYEEYAPFGYSAYQATTTQVHVPRKRIRFLGKERDSENGLYAIGRRYYAVWLCRWTNCDPAGLSDGPSLYTYAANNPVKNVDTDGMQSKPADEYDGPTIGPDYNYYRRQEAQRQLENLKTMTSSPFAAIFWGITSLFTKDEKKREAMMHLGAAVEGVAAGASGIVEGRAYYRSAGRPVEPMNPVAAEVRPEKAPEKEVPKTAPPAAPVEPHPAPAAAAPTPKPEAAPTPAPAPAAKPAQPAKAAPKASATPTSGSTPAAGANPSASGWKQAANTVLGTRISESPDLLRVWNATARPNDKKGTGREIFERHRDRFWTAVRGDPAARQIFLDAGATFPTTSKKAAPYITATGRGRAGTFSIDHIIPLKKQGAATDPNNLGFVITGDNVYMENMDKHNIRLQNQSQTRGWEENTRLNEVDDKLQRFLEEQNRK